MVLLIKKLRFLFLFLITLLFCLITALNAQMGLPRVTDFIFAVLFITSLLVIGEREHKLPIWLVVFGVIQLLQIALSLWTTHVWFEALKAFFAMVFFLILTVDCLRLTLKDKTISITTLFGSLSGYLFIGLAFACLYLTIYALAPDSFMGLKPNIEVRGIYYSFVTLTTVGFGDVMATSPLTQTLAWMEAFVGQAYLAVFISLLVGRYVAENQYD